jgi:BMFP domain-containing protein YqiC
MMKSQLQRLIADMDLVSREEFEAVKEMARIAREENELLKTRLDALEGKD